VSRRRVIGVAAFTALVGVNMLLAAQRLPVVSDFYTATDSTSLLGRLTGYILGVGIFEETTKALPLFWIFLHRRAGGGLREALFLGACSGLGFGVAEAVSYSFAYAAWHANLQLGDGGWVLAQLLRFITLPLLHALWSGVVGYFVGLAAMLPHRAWGLVAVGIGAVALVHGLYDTLGPWSSFALALGSFLVFVGYSRTAESVAERLQPADVARAA
jgi:RsiW-degrading membrane proteinase PrsW (M82 family)